MLLFSLSSVEQSRRDDLESIAYILLFFLGGFLPWQGIEASTKEKSERKIWKMKQAIAPADICLEGEPDYSYVMDLFHNTLIREGYQDGGVFDIQLRRNLRLRSGLPKGLEHPYYWLLVSI